MDVNQQRIWPGSNFPNGPVRLRRGQQARASIRFTLGARFFLSAHRGFLELLAAVAQGACFLRDMGLLVASDVRHLSPRRSTQ